MTITDFCEEVNNWFDVDRQFGVFTIADGKLSGVTDLKENQFFRIIGSVFNDGVYQNNSELTLTDESLTALITVRASVDIAIPKAVQEVAETVTETLLGKVILLAR